MISASAHIKVPFHDIDLLEVAWHGHYAKYFEIARCELFEKLDFNHEQMRKSGYAWPVIDLHIRYAWPARFHQLLLVTATLVEWENRLKVDYRIVDDETGDRISRGQTVQVAVGIETGEMCFASPAALLQRIERLKGSEA